MVMNQAYRVEISSEADLLSKAKSLEGMKISEIDELVASLDARHRKHTKGVVAGVVERGYFGIPANPRDTPDFEDLGVELKVSPLTFVESRGLVVAKERNVIAMVDYQDVLDSALWRNNKHLSQKLSRILFVFYLHETGRPAAEWRVIHTFLWSPDEGEDLQIQEDYEIIRDRIARGLPNSEKDNAFLGTCPKHAGGYKKGTPSSSPRGALCHHPTMGMAQKRGFCIKSKPLMRIIAKSLGVRTVRKGSSEGIPPSQFPHFSGWRGS